MVWALAVYLSFNFRTIIRNIKMKIGVISRSKQQFPQYFINALTSIDLQSDFENSVIFNPHERINLPVSCWL
jgi:hypothetical protein